MARGIGDGWTRLVLSLVAAALVVGGLSIAAADASKTLTGKEALGD